MKNLFMVNHLKTKFSILLGLILFSIFIYFRFIRERLPKDIPFNFSLLGFLIIVYICGIYIFIIYKLIVPSEKPNKFIETILEYLYTPLMDFDSFFKNIIFIKPYYHKIITKLAYKMNYLFENNIFEYIFYILPRVILVGTFIIDVFYFGKLYYIYKVLLIGILLVIRRYIIYSFKQFKKDFINTLDIDVYFVGTIYIPGVHESEWPQNQTNEEAEENDEWPPTMGLELGPFIDFWTNFTIYPNFIDIYPHSRNTAFAHVFEDVSAHYRNKICEDRGEAYYHVYVSQAFDDKHNNLTGFVRDELEKLIEKQVKDILQVAFILEYKTINDNDSRLNKLKIIIFSLYLICWMYILVKSFHTLDINELVELIISIKVPQIY